MFVGTLWCSIGNLNKLCPGIQSSGKCSLFELHHRYDTLNTYLFSSHWTASHPEFFGILHSDISWTVCEECIKEGWLHVVGVFFICNSGPLESIFTYRMWDQMQKHIRISKWWKLNTNSAPWSILE